MWCGFSRHPERTSPHKHRNSSRSVSGSSWHPPEKSRQCRQDGCLACCHLWKLQIPQKISSSSPNSNSLWTDVSRKHNYIKGIIDLYKNKVTRDSLTGIDYLQREDGSRTFLGGGAIVSDNYPPTEIANAVTAGFLETVLRFLKCWNTPFLALLLSMINWNHIRKKANAHIHSKC